jgi:hypothetical protein
MWATAIFSNNMGFLRNFVRDLFVGNLMGYKFSSTKISQKRDFIGGKSEKPE